MGNVKGYVMKKIEHWKWMVKQKEDKTANRTLVGDDKLKQEIEVLEDEILTLKKENAKLKSEVENAKKSNPYYNSTFGWATMPVFQQYIGTEPTQQLTQATATTGAFGDVIGRTGRPDWL